MLTNNLQLGLQTEKRGVDKNPTFKNPTASSLAVSFKILFIKKILIDNRISCKLFYNFKISRVSTMKNNYYIYVYCNPLKKGSYTYSENNINITFDYEPFYVGKGSGKRNLMHLEEAKDKNIFNHKVNTIRYILKNNKKPIIYKLLDNLEESPAYLLEKIIIKIIGRENVNNGPLHNIQDGGQGLSDPTGEIAKKISKTRKEKYAKGEITQWAKGTKGVVIAWNKGLTKETDKRVSNYARKMVGKKSSEEKCNNISKTHLLNGKNKGENNSMFNKTYYERWVELYGVKIANQKQKEYNKNMRLSTLGEKNGFFNKKHTKESNEKNRQAHLGKLSGEKNPMYKKSVYSVWVEKYGKEEADKKQELKNKKTSETLNNKTKDEKDEWSRKLKKAKIKKVL